MKPKRYEKFMHYIIDAFVIGWKGLIRMDKNFNEVLKEYDDEFLKGACMELFTLRETGSFPVDQKYFRRLCDERHRMYKDGRNIDAVKSDLLMEIARRWCEKE